MSTTVLISTEAEDEQGAALINGLPGAHVERYDPDSYSPANYAHAAVLIPPYRRSRRALQLAQEVPSLRLVALLSAGADRWIGKIPPNVEITDCRGAHGQAVAEWVVTAILSMYRAIPELVHAQHRHHWAHREVRALTVVGTRVLIVGAGDIGRGTADTLTTLGANTTLVGRSAREEVQAVNNLPQLLANADVVVLALPLTPATHHLFDRELLAAMPDGALLVNCSRGAVVDTEALIVELQAQRLQAALDVTEPEPLPKGHPLWTAPGCLITPHIARAVDGQAARAYEVVGEQVAAFLNGRSPPNLVVRDF